MRDIREGKCPICGHDQIVKGVPGEFAGESSTEVAAAFTYDQRWIMGGRNPNHAYGSLRYYMCRECGYVQWFVRNPKAVPIGKEYKTKLVKAGERTKKAPIDKEDEAKQRRRERRTRSQRIRKRD